MASLFKLEVGEWDEFKVRLHRAGLTAEQVREVVRTDDVTHARVMVEALIRDLNPPVDGAAEKPAIRITFEIAGRRYEAVSFVKTNETCDGDEMIARTDTENGGGLGQEDGEILWEHRAEWPEALKRHYVVFTKWRDPGFHRNVRCFYWDDDQWYPYWGGLDDQWDGHNLVVRRCT